MGRIQQDLCRCRQRPAARGEGRDRLQGSRIPLAPQQRCPLHWGTGPGPSPPRCEGQSPQLRQLGSRLAGLQAPGTHGARQQDGGTPAGFVPQPRGQTSRLEASRRPRAAAPALCRCEWRRYQRWMVTAARFTCWMNLQKGRQRQPRGPPTPPRHHHTAAAWPRRHPQPRSLARQGHFGGGLIPLTTTRERRAESGAGKAKHNPSAAASALSEPGAPRDTARPALSPTPCSCPFPSASRAASPLCLLLGHLLPAGQAAVVVAGRDVVAGEILLRLHQAAAAFAVLVRGGFDDVARAENKALGLQPALPHACTARRGGPAPTWGQRSPRAGSSPALT